MCHSLNKICESLRRPMLREEDGNWTGSSVDSSAIVNSDEDFPLVNSSSEDLACLCLNSAAPLNCCRENIECVDIKQLEDLVQNKHSFLYKYNSVTLQISRLMTCSSN